MSARRAVRACAVGVALAAGLAGRAGATEIERIRDCVRANAPGKTALATLSLDRRGADGEATLARARAYWRRSAEGEHRLLVRYIAPDDLAGAALLVRGVLGKTPIVHLFLPDLGDPQRVYSTEQVAAFLGPSDVTPTELRWVMDLAGEGDLRLLAEPSSHAGRAVWALEGRSDGGADRSARTVALVDREWCLPLEVAFHAHDGPRKLLRIAPADVRREGSRWLPRAVELEDTGARSRSRLTLDSVELDASLAPGLLTVRGLRGGGGPGR